MSGTESLGRVTTVNPPGIQHRGAPQYSQAQLAKMYPVIHVVGKLKELRAIDPHDYRSSQINDKFERNLCNLCNQERGHELHWF